MLSIRPEQLAERELGEIPVYATVVTTTSRTRTRTRIRRSALPDYLTSSMLAFPKATLHNPNSKSRINQIQGYSTSPGGLSRLGSGRFLRSHRNRMSRGIHILTGPRLLVKLDVRGVWR